MKRVHVGNEKQKQKNSLDLLLFRSETMPYLIISPHNLILDYHDQLELICQTNLLYSQDIQWLHNGNLVSRHFYLTDFSHRNILRINQIADQHAGNYQCFSNNSNSHQIIMSKPVTVTVRRRILSNFLFSFLFFGYLIVCRMNLAHPDSETRTVNIGHRLTLSCEIESQLRGGNFLGTIEWFHNGLPIKSNRNRIDYRNGTLTVDQTSVLFNLLVQHNRYCSIDFLGNRFRCL